MSDSLPEDSTSPPPPCIIEPERATELGQVVAGGLVTKGKVIFLTPKRTTRVVFAVEVKIILDDAIIGPYRCINLIGEDVVTADDGGYIIRDGAFEFHQYLFHQFHEKALSAPLPPFSVSVRP